MPREPGNCGRRKGVPVLGIAPEKWVSSLPVVPGSSPHPEPGMAKCSWVGNLQLLPTAAVTSQY